MSRWSPQDYDPRHFVMPRQSGLRPWHFSRPRWQPREGFWITLAIVLCMIIAFAVAERPL